MSGYRDVIAAHASRAKSLYAAKWSDLLAASGLNIKDDGSNNGSSIGDAKKYLSAIESVGGTVAITSARMALKAKAAELGLDSNF